MMTRLTRRGWTGALAAGLLVVAAFGCGGPEIRFAAQPATDNPPLADLLALDDALTQVCDAGFVVFGLGEADLEVIGVLTEITQLLAEHPRRSALRQQVYELLAKLAGNPYTATELATAEDLAISYLAAPVFVRSRAVYEVQLGPLQPSVGPANRSVYIDEVKAAAAALST